MSKALQATTRVLRERAKDKRCDFLNGLVKEVNLVRNFCNELSAKYTEHAR
jgi:hypothetical protein